MRKSLTKVIAFVVCLVFAISLVPAMYAAEKRITKDDRLLLQKPMNLMISIFPFLGSVIDTGNKSTSTGSSNITKKTLKPTAEIQIGGKPGNDRD
ncbi:MAG: hypothetical protein H5U06_05790 [Candidatus Aminicenantes bacterium]|nr:hypothetical protein [Candidatus Aminicenantes bacterium]